MDYRLSGLTSCSSITLGLFANIFKKVCTCKKIKPLSPIYRAAAACLAAGQVS
jgi:hypothetical protein